MSNVIQFPKKVKHQARDKKQSHQPSPTKKTTKPIALVLTSSSVCLMLLGVPFVSYFWQAPRKDRELASSEQQHQQKQKKHIQNKHILYLLKNRRLASIGQQPDDRENFLITELKSRYEIKWKRNNRDKLESCIVIEDYEPIQIPEIPILVEKYPTLFPEYHTMHLSPFSSEDLESYELQSKDGITTGMIEVMKDKQGRALSIYVQ